MAVITIGGQASKVGKTAVGAALIKRLVAMGWTAIKITQHEHEPPHDQPEIFVEKQAGDETDTARYLAAGAERALLISAPPGELSGVVPQVRREIAMAHNTLIESNSMIEFRQTDLVLFIKDPEVKDFKESAWKCLDRADAVLVRHAKTTDSARLTTSTPHFAISDEEWVPDELLEFVQEHLAAAAARNR